MSTTNDVPRATRNWFLILLTGSAGSIDAAIFLKSQVFTAVFSLGRDKDRGSATAPLLLVFIPSWSGGWRGYLTDRLVDSLRSLSIAGSCGCHSKSARDKTNLGETHW
jgi:hypothetical protein